MSTNRPIRVFSVAFCLSALILASQTIPAQAAPGPVLSEFPANNFPDVYDPLGCTDGNGNMIRVVCADGDCFDDSMSDLAIERRTPDGALITEPVPIAAADDLGRTTLVCNRAGDVAVVYEAEDCPYGVTVRADDAPLASFRVAASTPCSEINDADVRIDDERGLLTTWRRYSIRDGTDVMAQRHAADGAPVATPVLLTDDSDGANYALGSALDASGYALVAWQHEPNDATVPRFIMARALDPQGRAMGPPFSVSTGHLDYGTDVVARGNGVFFVVWQDSTREGRIGRRVSIDTDQVPGTTTTTLPPPEDFPAFQPPFVLATSGSLGAGGAWGVFEGVDATWSVGSGSALIYTPDDGRRWWARHSLLDADANYDLRTIVVAPNGEGVWLALLAPRDGRAAYVSRSFDDGRTWTEVEPLASWERISEDCSSCEVTGGAMANDAVGNVVIVWGFHDAIGFYDDSGQSRYTALQRIYSIASHDGGLSWGPLTLVADERGSGSQGLALATDERGTWVVSWIDTSPSDGAFKDVYFARSANDGRTWATPGALAGGLELAGYRQPSRLDLAATATGEYVALFTASLKPYEADADVFAVRSADGGKTWKGPVPVNAYAAHDGGDDLFGAVATDGSGRWLALWSALEPLGSVGFDRDIVGAMSVDAGATWSWPVRLDAAALADSAMDVQPRLAADARGVWLAAWTSGGDWYDSSAASVVAAVAGDRCGDGSLDVGEGCDDGNAIDDDGCDHNCTPPGCGNGVLNPGEPCDDGNVSNEDACLAGCTLPSCGDGYVWRGVEECDDRNNYDLDGCMGDCRLPYCGDGYVRDGEECDDANADNHDACTDQCAAARCLDGYVQAGEECDDGNRVDHDYCTEECRIAACGDGAINADEACDLAIESQAAFCTGTCVIADRCGDSDASGDVTSSDARRILKTAVGDEAPCPRSVCEMDGNDRITTTDAKMALHIAVGLEVDARCSMAEHRSIVFFLRDPVFLGALQLHVDYSASEGLFLGPNDRVDCEVLVDATLTGFNNVPALGELRVGIISLAGFTGPDFARCSFAPTDAEAVIMTTTVEDAAAPDLTPTTPFPTVGYRLE